MHQLLRAPPPRPPHPPADLIIRRACRRVHQLLRAPPPRPGCDQDLQQAVHAGAPEDEQHLGYSRMGDQGLARVWGVGQLGHARVLRGEELFQPGHARAPPGSTKYHARAPEHGYYHARQAMASAGCSSNCGSRRSHLRGHD